MSLARSFVGSWETGRTRALAAGCSTLRRCPHASGFVLVGNSDIAHWAYKGLPTSE
jgi:hypothetical protein